jgi:hypothetical protein
MKKTNSDASLRVMLRLLIDKMVEDLSRTAWQTRRRPGVNNAPKLSKPSHPFINGDADSRSLALANHLSIRYLNELGRIRFIGNTSALLFAGSSCKASAKQSRSRYVRSAYKFGDNHCPGGYLWFARRRIGLNLRDVDHSEASGPAQLIGKSDCTTGGAVFRLHWRKRPLAARRYAAQRR